MARPFPILSFGLLAFAPGHALAEGLFSPEAFSGVIVAGPAAASGEPSWIKGGLGKLRAGGDHGAFDATATVAWRGNLTSRVGALVSVDAQSDVAPVAGVSEAYLTLRPDPGAAVRISGRAGVFFPPVSLEHDGSEWSLSRTLTPSAINSWVAEEVKVAGVELTARGAVAGHPWP
uniref:Uncharacterized protein n=1 Tax=Phenylobacterium glaciei TaxID=2803784 RepID=A0A974SB42_9CAUL|nr:hypothetical protein JKL49_10000 [Phenylobacterium glaciei]